MLPEICPYAQHERFGGVESLFTGLAFAMLIVTAWMQKEELELQRKEHEQTREELREQLFDTRFFSLLQAFNNVIQNTTWYDEDSKTAKRYEGKESFKYIHRNWEVKHKDKILQAQQSPLLTYRRSADLFPEIIRDEWKEFYSENAHNLGQYYRTLFNLMKFVDNAPEGIDREFRADIVRESLSDHEQALLLYKLIADNDEFGRLAKKYRLIKHVRGELLIHEDHRGFFPYSTSEDR
ncbi:putative phage abortive infection protein [bacterium]|nr:putative phage abortive infection protein [bacterium]